jgi:hypothetical protein
MKQKKIVTMDLRKELLEFLEANNNFGLEEPEKIVDIYIDVYKEGKSENIILNNKNNEDSSRMVAITNCI